MSNLFFYVSVPIGRLNASLALLNVETDDKADLHGPTRLPLAEKIVV